MIASDPPPLSGWTRRKIVAGDAPRRKERRRLGGTMRSGVPRSDASLSSADGCQIRSPFCVPSECRSSRKPGAIGRCQALGAPCVRGAKNILRLASIYSSGCVVKAARAVRQRGIELCACARIDRRSIAETPQRKKELRLCEPPFFHVELFQEVVQPD